jgi:hypothetical protein
MTTKGAIMTETTAIRLGGSRLSEDPSGTYVQIVQLAGVGR